MVTCCVGISGYDVRCVHPDAPESREERRRWSEHAKALAALADGQLQHPVHLFIRVICREAQLVETRRAKGEVVNSENWRRLDTPPRRHSGTYHVCAVGSVLWVGAAMIWKEGQRAAKPPGGS